MNVIYWERVNIDCVKGSHTSQIYGNSLKESAST